MSLSFLDCYLRRELFPKKSLPWVCRLRDTGVADRKQLVRCPEAQPMDTLTLLPPQRTLSLRPSTSMGRWLIVTRQNRTLYPPWYLRLHARVNAVSSSPVPLKLFIYFIVPFLVVASAAVRHKLAFNTSFYIALYLAYLRALLYRSILGRLFGFTDSRPAEVLSHPWAPISVAATNSLPANMYFSSLHSVTSKI